MARETMVSTKSISGHLKRAQSRIEKAVKGSSQEDVMIQAVLGVAGVSLCLRLLRVDAISRLVSMIAPFAVVGVIASRAGRGSSAAR